MRLNMAYKKKEHLPHNNLNLQCNCQLILVSPSLHVDHIRLSQKPKQIVHFRSFDMFQYRTRRQSPILCEGMVSGCSFLFLLFRCSARVTARMWALTQEEALPFWDLLLNWCPVTSLKQDNSTAACVNNNLWPPDCIWLSGIVGSSCKTTQNSSHWKLGEARQSSERACIVNLLLLRDPLPPNWGCQGVGVLLFWDDSPFSASPVFGERISLSQIQQLFLYTWPSKPTVYQPHRHAQ